MHDVAPHAAVSTVRPMDRIRAIMQSRFLRHNALFFAGAVAVGLLNYAYYPIMGRILAPASFGEVQTLFSLFAQAAIFLNVFSLLTVTIVANNSDDQQRDTLLAELEKLALLAGAVLLILVALATPILQDFFRFEDRLPFILLAGAVLAATPLAFRSGFLRGRQKFGTVTLISIAVSLCNIGFSAGLALAGFGASGAIIGLVIGQAAGFGLAAWYARRHGLLGRTKRRGIQFKLLAPELRYALLVLIGSLAITGLYSLDVIVIKHYFDAETAGLYAGIATVARIIFFATASVVQVMLPAIKLQREPSENSRSLRNSLGLLLLIGGLPLLLFYAAPNQVVSLLMGSEYSRFAPLLPFLATALLMIAILNLIVMYHIALRRYMAGVLALSGIVAAYILTMFNHQTVEQVVGSLFAGACLSLFAVTAWSGYRYITQQRRVHG